MTDGDRLFVPLKSEHYRNFESGLKDVELRGYGSGFNTATVVTGRPVELRRGYNTNDSLLGVIGHVATHDAIDEVADVWDHTRIVPGTNRREFEAGAEALLSPYDRFISFAVGNISDEPPAAVSTP